MKKSAAEARRMLSNTYSDDIIEKNCIVRSFKVTRTVRFTSKTSITLNTKMFLKKKKLMKTRSYSEFERLFELNPPGISKCLKDKAMIQSRCSMHTWKH